MSAGGSTNRILWHSNAPFALTGYGVQTAMFTPRIKALGYDVAISCFWGLGGARLEWEHGITLYPADDQWGNRLLPAYAAHHGGGELRGSLVITLEDVFVLNNHKQFQQMNMACWVPIDHDPVPPNVRQFFELSGARPIAMSRHGEGRLRQAGLDPLYVPHGVETKVYKPVGDRAGIRKAMDVPADCFLVGMVAMNKGSSPPRKAFPQALEAFKKFLKRHGDAVLYLHTERFGAHGGINLTHIIEALEIPETAIRWAPQLEMELGIPPEAMAHLYSAMDVMMLPSYGEGFGIPLIEAQSCGTPVITGGWTSMPELVGPGWMVEGERFYNASQGAWWHCPIIGSIVDALDEAYDLAASKRDAARKFASRYDADLIATSYWRPVLEKLTAPSLMEAIA